MVIESAIHDAKGIAAQTRVFKRPKKDETRFEAGCRRILGGTWLRYEVEREISFKEIPMLPSQRGEITNKFVRLSTVSEGDEKFALQPVEKRRRLMDPIRETIVLPTGENYLENRDPEPEVIPETPEERKQRERMSLFGKMNVAQLRLEFQDRGWRIFSRYRKENLIDLLVNDSPPA
jgi:hypothetical protein